MVLAEEEYFGILQANRKDVTKGKSFIGCQSLPRDVRFNRLSISKRLSSDLVVIHAGTYGVVILNLGHLYRHLLHTSQQFFAWLEINLCGWRSSSGE